MKIRGLLKIVKERDSEKNYQRGEGYTWNSSVLSPELNSIFVPYSKAGKREWCANEM